MILLISRMLNSVGSCGIMSMNYSTQGIKATSHLKIDRLIMFMRNYGHEQLNKWTSWGFKASNQVLLQDSSRFFKNLVLPACQDEGSLGDQQWFSRVDHVQGVDSGRDTFEVASAFLIEAEETLIGALCDAVKVSGSHGSIF
ncbi:hypothetical protein MTR67_051804 [Solanum verrucosum]|uniref:Uncharacterized protein n=1 Tax=Solanum verrucosum TaxID=315347 RepID=A0AAF0V6X8_SOLVR|nr:hypothetical protein MTR67_051804 [Solanum verrucosum]